jgi:hypothetical protein
MRKFLLSLIAVLVTSHAIAQPSAVQPLRVAAVMAPLSFLPAGCLDYDSGGRCSIRPEVLQHFDALLSQAHNVGVGVVSVDVWWRLIEGRGDEAYPVDSGGSRCSVS